MTFFAEREERVKGSFSLFSIIMWPNRHQSDSLVLWGSGLDRKLSCGLYLLVIEANFGC